MATKTPNYQLNKPAQDEFYDIDILNENADILDRELKSLADSKATTATYTATLTAGGWSSSAPYTQTVSVAGILGTDNPITGVILPDDKESMEVQREAWFCVSKIDTADGSIKATCLEEKPAVSLNIQMKVVR